jgi:hypothetical protein
MRDARCIPSKIDQMIVPQRGKRPSLTRPRLGRVRHHPQPVSLLLVVEITMPRVVKRRVRVRVLSRSYNLQRALHLGTSDVID